MGTVSIRYMQRERSALNSPITKLIKQGEIMLQINGADLVRIRDQHYNETGEDLSFKECVAKYKEEKGL